MCVYDLIGGKKTLLHRVTTAVMRGQRRIREFCNERARLCILAESTFKSVKISDGFAGFYSCDKKVV